jgi:SAM-dependent methyltransferase
MTHDLTYDDAYYARDVETAAVEGAGVISRSIVSWFRPASVIDVGCGTGALLAALRERGCKVAGLEYSEAALKYCRARQLDVVKFDIEHDNPAATLAGTSYDVAVSFEVAEHLPEAVAGRYVSLLCGLAPAIVLTAAKPGRGGTDHVNEQPPSYWIARFAAHGFRHDEACARAFTSEWSQAGIASFYHDSVMIFRSHMSGPG